MQQGTKGCWIKLFNIFWIFLSSCFFRRGAKDAGCFLIAPFLLHGWILLQGSEVNFCFYAMGPARMNVPDLCREVSSIAGVESFKQRSIDVLLLFQQFEKGRCHYRNDGYFFSPGQKMQEIY